jgi:hypothetical protein
VTHGPPLTRRARRREFRLRPLEIMELLDEALALYRANAGLFIAVIWFPALLAALCQTAMQTSVVGLRLADPTSDEALASVGWFVLAVVIGAPVMFLAWAYQQAALTAAISARYLNRDAGAREVRRRVGSLLWRLIGAYLLSSLLMANAFIVAYAIVAGVVVAGLAAESPLVVIAIPLGCGGVVFVVFVWALFALIAPAIVVEDLGVWGSITRSARLVRSSFWRVLGTLLLLFIIGFVLQMVINSAISLPLMAVGLVEFAATETTETTPLSMLIQGVAVLVEALIGALVVPFTLGTTVLLYFDIRIRKEGFDIEMLARSMGGPPAPDFVL